MGLQYQMPQYKRCKTKVRHSAYSELSDVKIQPPTFLVGRKLQGVAQENHAGELTWTVVIRTEPPSSRIRPMDVK